MERSKYWWRYVLEGNAEEIDAQLQFLPLGSEGSPCELLHFALRSTQPVLVISRGSAGHAYVFAELGYRIHQRGYNVFIMPRHGGLTISQLIELETEPPRELSALTTPTMFIADPRTIRHLREGPVQQAAPGSEAARGSRRHVFWMVSHPGQAAEVTSAWCEETSLGIATPRASPHDPTAIRRCTRALSVCR